MKTIKIGDLARFKDCPDWFNCRGEKIVKLTTTHAYIAYWRSPVLLADVVLIENSN